MMQVTSSEDHSQKATSSYSWTKKQKDFGATVSLHGRRKKRPASQQIQTKGKRSKLEEKDARRVCVVNFDDFARIARKHEGIKSVSFMDQLFYVMLEDFEGSFSKLVDQMSHRTLLASIIAATEKEDCLTRFVQLGGLRILNDWLQDARKVKVDDCLQDAQTVSEGLLLMLIQALAKLPVDFHALKNCIVGKSVNKLRSHHNLEIQKRARELVADWKKRVNAEMKSTDHQRTETFSAVPCKVAKVARSTRLHDEKSTVFSKSVSMMAGGTGDSRVDEHPMSFCKDLSMHDSGRIIGAMNERSVQLVEEKDNLINVKKEKEMLSVVKKENENIPLGREDKSLSQSQSQNNSQTYNGLGNGNRWSNVEGKPIPVVPMGHEMKVHGHTRSQRTAAAAISQKESTGKQKCKRSLEKKRVAKSTSTEPCNARLIVRLPNPSRTSSQAVCLASPTDRNTATNRGSPDLVSQDNEGESIMTTPRHHQTKAGDPRQETHIVTDESHMQHLEVDKDCMSVGLEHKSKEIKVSSPQSNVQKTMSSKCKKSPSHPTSDVPLGGIDLLASVAVCEVIETENLLGRNNEVEVQSVSTDAFMNPPVQERMNSSHQQEGDGPDDSTLMAMEQAPLCPERKRAIPACNANMEGVHDGNEQQLCTNLIARGEEEIASVGTLVSCLTSSQIPITSETSLISGIKSCEDYGAAKESCVASPAKNAKVVDSLKSNGGKAPVVAGLVAMDVKQEVDNNFKVEVLDDKSGHPCGARFICGSNSKASGVEPDAGVSATHASTIAGTRHQEALEDRMHGTSPPCGFLKSDETLLKGMLPKKGEIYSSDSKEETVRHSADAASDSVPVLRHMTVSVSSEKGDCTGAGIKRQSCFDETRSSDGLCETSNAERLAFDLNKGFNEDGLESNAAVPCLESSFGAAAQMSSVAAPIAVVASNKGAFVPSSNSTCAKGDLGWKRSGATSAFRPAEPRLLAEPFQTLGYSTASLVATTKSGKQSRMLDIDLNVADERVLEDSCTSARLPFVGRSEPLIDQESNLLRPFLDLNRAGDNDDLIPSVLASSDTCDLRARVNVPPSAVPRVMLDIDLNDGFGSQGEGSCWHTVADNPHTFVTERTRHDVDIANASSWNLATCLTSAATVVPSPTTINRFEYPVVTPPGLKQIMSSGNIHSGIAVPSHEVCGSGTIPTSFSYAGFPSGSSFSLAPASYNMGFPCSSAAFSSSFLAALPPQLCNAGAVVSPYASPYLMGNLRGIPGSDFSAAWMRPSVDVNIGHETNAQFDYRESMRQMMDLSHKSPLIPADSFCGWKLEKK